MDINTIDIKTKDGAAPCHFYHPPQDAKRPAVIIYMDAFGIRPALCEMAQRLAGGGFHTLLPNLYYRSGPVKPFDATAFQDGLEKDRLMPLFKSLNNKRVMSDTEGFLSFLENEPRIAGQKIGCVGYCMGGAFALSAAGAFPGRIAAAASFHGARLATDQPDSPHLLANKMRATVYVGVAEHDQHFSAGEKQRLEAALQAANVKHTIEVYPGAKHGFAPTDTPAYDKAASERHWAQLLKLFRETLG